MSDMDAAVSEFLIESDENLSQVERDLVNLEETPDQSTLSSIFRAIHTIKGTCAFLGYAKLESLAHTGETLLSLVRDGELELTPEITSALLTMVDAIRQMLESIEQAGTDGEKDYSELKARLTALQKGEHEVPSVSVPSAESEEPTVQQDKRPEPAVAQAEPIPVDPSMYEAISEFLIESDENLSQVERDLVDLEGTPDPEVLSSIFRAIHTIKGTCSFLGFTKLESLAHVGETLLSLIRDGELVLTPGRTSGLLTMVDAIRQMLALIEQRKHDGTEDYADLKAQLIALQQDGPVAQVLPTPTPENSQSASQTGSESGSPIEHSPVMPQATPPSSQKLEARPSATDHRGPAVADSTIRVDVGLLDKLMNMVGELVLTRNQILQSTSMQQDAGLLASSQRLSLITSELQEGIMKTRMQQIGNVWSKFPRVVRDLALSCGKEIRIEMEGKETELDKTLIEAIKDPLTHLVRNSVDHGVEPPDVRVQNGKPREGILLLRAYHEGGQVNIEITDDGGGINAQRVSETAIKRGVVTQEQVSRMQERELLGLIFLPGFSTAEKVTNVSGRGVGMDVVKTNIEKIGGTIDISTKLGKGTTFKLKVPLTLAIIPALIVTVGKERFAIPQVSLLELVRTDAEQSARAIELVHGAPVYRLRGQLLPLVYLSKVVKLHGQSETGEGENNLPDVANIVVLQADTHRFGLVVDEVNDTEEIVVKPLGKQLKGLPVYAGATIMGDGRVALILDVFGVAQRANLVSGHGSHPETEHAGLGSAKDHVGKLQTLLLIKVGGDGRVAIPVPMVARLEEMPNKVLEAAGGQEVVQYREKILPVIRLSSVLAACGYHSENDGDSFQMVVIAHQGRQVGIIVDHIVDIVDVQLGPQTKSDRPGILGSVVVQQVVTDLLDIEAVLNSRSFSEVDQLLPEFLGA